MRKKQRRAAKENDTLIIYTTRVVPVGREIAWRTNMLSLFNNGQLTFPFLFRQRVYFLFQSLFRSQTISLKRQVKGGSGVIHGRNGRNSYTHIYIYIYNIRMYRNIYIYIHETLAHRERNNTQTNVDAVKRDVA